MTWTRTKTVLATVLVFVVGGVGYFFLPSSSNVPAVRGSSDFSGDSPLAVTRAAITATESLEVAEADVRWSLLHEQNPQNKSIALNHALNRTLLIAELSAIATNPALDETEQATARATFPDAVSGTRDSIESYAELSGDDVIAAWMRAEVDIDTASMTQGADSKSILRNVYERLTKAIRGELGVDRQSMILGGSLIRVLERLEDPVNGLPVEIREEASATLATLSRKHTDNLFFALRALRFNINSKNPACVEFLQRATELSAAIEPSVAVETAKIGLKPGQLVTQISSAIDSEDWASAASRSTLWLNVLNSSEIVKTDRRRASPHPLDLLSFEDLRRLSAAQAIESPIPRGQDWPEYQQILLSDSKGFKLVHPIDFDLDLDSDLVGVDREGVLRLWRNDDGRWSRAGQVKLEMVPSALIVADLFMVDSSDPGRLRSDRFDSSSSNPASTSRHDTLLHLIAQGDDGVRVIRIDAPSASDGDAKLSIVDDEIGLEGLRDVTASVAGDLEADGDLDLVFATRRDGIRVFINRGNRTFFELSSPVKGFGVGDVVSSLAIADFDRDLDLDILTTHPVSGRIGVIENLLHLQFRGRFLDGVPKVPGAASLSIEDIDGNVSWDLVVGGESSATIVFSHTADSGAWRVDRVEQCAHGADDGVIVDTDNDSWMEVISRGEASRIGPWGWGEWKRIDAMKHATGVVVADFDNDGGMDLAATGSDGIAVYRNDSESRGHFVDLRFKGIDDNATGRVNHYAIGTVLETRFGPHYRARIVTEPATHFGLDGVGQAANVRAIFPNGLTQTISDPSIDTIIEEEQTLKGSCPYLYAWDGSQFAFVTDCLWAAPLGLQVAHGVVAKDRPWEYLKVDGRMIRPKGDRYEFRMTEELWEVAYFDEVKLTVVDHPSDVQVWTNEKVGPDNVATPTIFAFTGEERYPILDAVDTYGTDVTAQLAEVDEDFVQGFDRRLRQGLCEPHWIDMRFDENVQRVISSKGDKNESSIYLVLTGWIMPTDTSLNIQIDQNPNLRPIEFPSVWVPDAESESGWRNAIPFMGFPGGKTKTIVVDVTDVANPDDPRFRVRTSAQIYWDKAELVVQSSPARMRVQDAPLLSAEIGFHGFSRHVRQGRRRPETYDYQDVSVSARWPPLKGKMSRYGDCLDLVREWDDRMAVISSGDEMRLAFSVPPLKPPQGWVRDFVLHNVGWDKDADLNTLRGQQIGPLPFRGMTQYPPAPNDASQVSTVERLNQMHLSRRQRFRSFWYREQQAPPMQFTESLHRLQSVSSRWQ